MTKGVFTNNLDKEQERAILSLYVTSPFSDIFGVYDTLPPEQFATLSASFSRTHEPFQQRLLSSIVSGDISLPNMDVLKDERGRKKELTKINPKDIQQEFNNFTENWRVPEEKGKAFIQKWAQQYGHNSIKELGNARFVTENIPDITGKLITRHPLAHPQVKSSRYIDWDKVLDLSGQNLDIKESLYSDLIISTLNDLGYSYRLITSGLESFARGHQVNNDFLNYRLSNLKGKETKESVAAALDADCKKSILDYSRYLLTPAMATSLGCSIDVRGLEEVVTGLLSSPLKQDNLVGQRIWDETRKTVPVLMGDKSHAEVNNYTIATREEFSKLLPSIYDFEKNREFEITDRANFPEGIEPGTDLFVAATASWQYGNGSFMQYFNHLKNSPKDIGRVIDALFDHRGIYDAFPPSTLISAPLIETLMDYGGDRDNHRHRRGSFLRQTLTAEHGFETPQIIKDAGLIDEYSSVIQKASDAYDIIRKDSSHVAQLVVPFANKCRRLLSWSQGQGAYYTELRSKGTGHDSYRNIAFAIADKMVEKSPLVASNLRVEREVYPQHLAKGSRKWYDTNKRK